MIDATLYVVVAAITTAIAALIFVLAYRKNRTTPHRVEATAVGEVATQSNNFGPSDLQAMLNIQSLDLQTYQPSQLSEVKDSTVIARLDSLLVPVVETVAKVLAPSLKNAYQVTLPKGVELAKSKEVEGLFRAFYRDGKKIAGHANLQKIDPTTAAAVANVAANAMNVAALVVGQQFMAEISSKLDSINSNLDAIADRLDASLRSTVQSELALVSEISQFRAEILESDEERNRKLIALDAHKVTIAHALGQVNILIEQESKRFEGKQGSKGVKSYQEVVHRLQSLARQQEILVALLREVSDLSYLFGLGQLSKQASSAVYNTYLEGSAKVRDNLGDWHRLQVEKLKIDLESDRAKKGLFEAIPGLVVERWKYVSTDAGLDQEIEQQGRLGLTSDNSIPEVYEKDVDVIMKDGKYYFLRPESDGNASS